MKGNEESTMTPERQEARKDMVEEYPRLINSGNINQDGSNENHVQYR